MTDKLTERIPAISLGPSLLVPTLFDPERFEWLQRVANVYARSGMVPKEYVNKPAAIAVAFDAGYRMGLGFLESLNGIAVINGRPTVWGDVALAVCQRSRHWGGMKERGTPEVKARQEASCTIGRLNNHGEVEYYTATFSVDDAKTAKLWGNPSKDPWVKYPYRMLQRRARLTALRDAHADALTGLSPRELVEDDEERIDVQTRDAGQRLGPIGGTAAHVGGDDFANVGGDTASSETPQNGAQEPESAEPAPSVRFPEGHQHAGKAVSEVPIDALVSTIEDIQSSDASDQAIMDLLAACEAELVERQIAAEAATADDDPPPPPEGHQQQLIREMPEKGRRRR